MYSFVTFSVEDSIVDNLCETNCVVDQYTFCTLEGGKFVCDDKCTLFNQKTHCSEKGLWASGTCEYGQYANPYCK